MEINENKPIEKDELTGDKLLSGHEYDGIKELDNRLPRWWLWLFILSIVWAVVYLLYYNVTKKGPDQDQEFQTEMKNNPPPAALFDTNQVAMTDAASLDGGKAVFQKLCVACHLEQGQGKIGPNLCDAFTIHGCDFKSTLKVIAFGVPEKGMIAWKAQLSKDEIVKVASYIMTLKGTNPPNPKAPQGDPCK